MKLRRFIRKAINAAGYDMHKQERDCSPYFDPEFSAVRTATLNDTTARLFVSDRRDVIQAHHFSGRFYEADILREISKRFFDGGCFVDIGANVGDHVLYIASRFPKASLVAFEPMRKQHVVLMVNMLLNDLAERIKLYKLAASDSDGIAQMITPFQGNLGRSMISDSVSGEWVEKSRVDPFLAGRQVDFIKIDVEGHEMKTLAGLDETVRRSRPSLLVEVAERNKAEFVNWLERNRYRIDIEFKHRDQNSEIFAAPAGK
ncbi:MAG: FkbM family methyltransferase [Pseudomonadota bacterium]